MGELLVLDASFVSKSGRWGAGWFWSGMARAVRWGMEVTLPAAVDIEEGGTYPLCARQSPGTVRARRQTCGVTTGRATTVEVGLSLLREAVAAGAKDRLGVRWMAADGGYASRTFWRACAPWTCTRWADCARMRFSASPTPSSRTAIGPLPPHPAATPVAAHIPSRTGADQTLNTPPQPAQQYDSGL